MKSPSSCFNGCLRFTSYYQGIPTGQFLLETRNIYFHDQPVFARFTRHKSAYLASVFRAVHVGPFVPLALLPFGHNNRIRSNAYLNVLDLETLCIACTKT